MSARLTRKSGHGSPPLGFFDEQNTDGSNSSGPGISRDRLGSGAAGRRPVEGASRSGGPWLRRGVEFAKQGHGDQEAIAFLSTGLRRRQTL